jgi:hypothetical protein
MRPVSWARHPHQRWMRALVLLLAVLGGCRGDSGVEDAGADGAFVVRMVPGTRMVFDHWQLDRLGARISDSRTTRTWTVIAEDVKAFGFNDAVLVMDSIAGERVDSLFFRFSPPGDVFAYGYLARMIQRREGTRVPPGWDRIAAFSLLPPVTWPVGYVDSTQTLRAVGETTGEVLFFEVQLNGVRTAVPARQADISKSNLLASLWLSSTPSAAIRLREEVLVTSAQIGGELSELLSITTLSP